MRFGFSLFAFAVVFRRVRLLMRRKDTKRMERYEKVFLFKTFFVEGVAFSEGVKSLCPGL